jgi:hypothetical protein
MKLGTVLRSSILVVVIAAVLGQWWLVRRTQEEAARFIARLVPQGELRYERLWPFPWGAGRAWGVSFQPEGLLRMSLQTAPGFRIQARELRVDEIQFAASGSVERLRGSLRDVRVPVQDLRALTAEGSDPTRIAPPTLFDLGYDALEFDLAFDVQYIDAANLALLRLNLAGTDIGHAVLHAQLEGTPQTFDRAPDQILVRKLELDYADAALLARFREVSAARARIGIAAWESAITEYLERRAARERWKWDDETAAAARELIRNPAHFRAVVDPPGDVILRNIRLYALADWPVLLGFSLTTEGVFDHPAPVEPSSLERLMDSVLRSRTELESS